MTTAARWCCSARTRYGRGLPLDYYAYPTFGLPDYQPIAPPIDAAVAYSIARQESHFNQKVVSPAHAMGLMQVTPGRRHRHRQALQGDL